MDPIQSDIHRIVLNRDTSALLSALDKPGGVDGIIQAVRIYGLRNGIKPESELQTDYHFLITTLRQRNEHLFQQLGTYQTLIGHGWDLWSVRIGFTYTLTYEGIRKVVELYRVKASVIDSAKGLRQYLQGLRVGETRALITDKRLLCDDELIGHAISVFVRRKKRVLELINNDSEGDPCVCYRGIRSKMPMELRLRTVASKVNRQLGAGPVCNAFAVSDCIALQDDPSRFDQIMTQRNKTKMGGAVVVNELPDAFMRLARSIDAQEAAIEYQSAVIRHELNSSRVEPVGLRALMLLVGTVYLLAFVTIVRRLL